MCPFCCCTTFYISLGRGEEAVHASAIFVIVAAVLREMHAFKVIDDYPSIFDCLAG